MKEEREFTINFSTLGWRWTSVCGPTSLLKAEQNYLSVRVEGGTGSFRGLSGVVE